MTSLFFFLLGSLDLIFSTAQATVKLPKNVTIPAVFMFGDSTVDTGNNNNLVTIIKSNFPPYGRDFMGGVATGRFGNGKVPSDIFVEELGIKKLLPAYLDPSLQKKDFPTGVSFASGASGFDPLTSEMMSVIPLSEQLLLLKEYKEKLKNYVGGKRAKSIVSKSLHFVVTGSDDLVNTYFHTPARSLQYDIDAYTDFMVVEASAFLQELYASRARRIVISGLPPVGCLPSMRTVDGGSERNCVARYNQAAELFNSKLSAEVDRLNKQLFHAKVVVLMDVYRPLMDIILKPQKYGFKVEDKGCCGTGRIERFMYVKNPRSFRKIASSNTSLAGSVGVGKVSKMEPVAFVSDKIRGFTKSTQELFGSLVHDRPQPSDPRHPNSWPAKGTRVGIDLSECPPSLAKASYTANGSNWLSAIAIPVGAQCRDVAVITSPLTSLVHRKSPETMIEALVPPLGTNSQDNRSTGSVALMLESELDEFTKLGGWIEMKQSNPKHLEWAVTVADDSEDSVGWGIALIEDAAGVSWTRFVVVL
ncbi:hypothetical protein DVH24_013026 [Malus domestica]|uniref:GDSL esterase/lipase EXL3 n=1 Tax=Malus domestica TaxID=3750 RepID=A0A498HTP5_MALDO|nr:hypothetical protein DVH24_013026 [Malus domestica]